MEQTSQVVSSLDGKESPIPPVTTDRRKASDERMSKLLKVPRFAGSVVPNSVEERESARGERASGEEPKATSPAGEPAPVKTSEGESPSQETAATPTDGGEKQAAPKTDWEQESRKHQSRADKAETTLKEIQTKHDELSKQTEELKRYKEQVDAFTSDPMGYMMKYVPNLVQQIATSGDPVKAIEAEMIEFQKQLDSEFFKTHGEDWRYDEHEALRPGTPSFRYKLALDDRLSEARSRYRNFMDNQKRKQEEAQKQIVVDKERLTKEFGFTDKDFTEAEEYFAKNKVSYYDLARAILIDKIIQKKLDSIVPPSTPPKDISQAPKGGDALVSSKPKISDGGRAVLARMGKAVFK